MLNAVSGAGKTATIQYCEHAINGSNKNGEENPLALAVSFNLHRFGDRTELTADQSLTMRLAERFLNTERYFQENLGGLRRTQEDFVCISRLCHSANIATEQSVAFD